ncbi:MAG: TraR/DksA C4-type zinc finger protein [Nitrospira defluvii]|nr:TraR/DksA C4-type zinc finger protein [Nitrospira defluvii]
MNLVHQAYPIFGSRPRRPEVSSLRRELLSARSELLLQASNWTSPHIAREKSEDALELAYSSHQWAVDDLIVQQASAKLRQVERALDHMRDASYGICRECRSDISLSRLRRQPQAVLCTGCVEERLEHLSADAL